jgi:hypothetical protein
MIRIETTPDVFGGTDTDRVEAAFQAIRDSGGTGHVELKRRYSLERPLIFPDMDGFSMTGDGPSTGFDVDPNFPQLAVALSSAVGQRGIKMKETSTVAAAKGDRRIPVTNWRNFPNGSNIKIGSATTAADGSAVLGYQHNRVTGVTTPGYLDLELPLPFPCAAGSSVVLVSLRSGLRLGGFTIYSDVPVEHNALALLWEADAVLEDYAGIGQGRFQGAQTRAAALLFKDGFRNRVRGIAADLCGCGGQNAIKFVANTGMKIADVAARSSTFGIGLAQVTDSEAVNLSCDSDQARAIKLSSAKRNILSNLRVRGARYTGLAFSGWTTDNAVHGFSVSDPYQDGDQLVGLWFNGQSNNGNYLSGGIVRNCPSAAVSIAPTDNGNVVRGVFNGVIMASEGSTSRVIVE